MQKFATTLMLIAGAFASDSMKKYSSGMVYFDKKVSHGRYKASIKASSMKGTGTAFFLADLDDGLEDVYDFWNAIAVVPSSQSMSALNTKFSDDFDEDWMNHYPKDVQEDQFHEYEIEFTPNYLKYSLDGVEIRRKDFTPEDDAFVEYNLGLSLQSLANTDEPDASNLPTQSQVDWVEIWDYDVNTNIFFRRLRDDFYDLPNWWIRSDMKTNDETTSNFKTEYAQTSDGLLLLSLDRNQDYKEEEKNPSPGFKHDLPAPQEGTLDASIEKATRAAVTLVRDYLESFSQSVAEHYYPAQH